MYKNACVFVYLHWKSKKITMQIEIVGFDETLYIFPMTGESLVTTDFFVLISCLFTFFIGNFTFI